MKIIINAAILNVLSSIIFSVSSHVIIETSLGPIKGTTMLSREGKTFYAFLGLPFAEPPIGNLRFRNPVPYTTPWNYTYDATQEREVCAQCGMNWIFKGSEDCLYLNLYTPMLPNTNFTKLPVWFYIYPGRRLFGDPSYQRWGPHYIMDEPVIFISASYRVGALGFLSMEDDIVPGNFGLKDQAAVLLWIKRYIADFGGDPNRVTISGESSGAVDASLHLFSPLAKPLFHRAILQSGFCLNFRTITQLGGGREKAWKLAEITGCKHPSIKTSEHLLQCFRFLSAEQLTTSLAFMMHDYLFPHTYFGVVIEKADIEGAFLTSHPFLEILKPTNKTLLLGFNTDEAHQKAAGMYYYPTTDVKLRKQVLHHYCKNSHRLFPMTFAFDHMPNRLELLEIVKTKYFSNKRLEDSYQEVSKVLGLLTIQFNVIEAALQYRGITYLYHYDHLNKQSYRKMYDIMFSFQIKESMGVVHGEEFRSLFHQPILFPPVITGDDRIVSNQIVKLWSNFVIYGNPNGNDKQVWKPVSSPSVEYLYFHNLTYSMRTKPLWEDYQFLKRLKSPTIMSQELYEKFFLDDGKIPSKVHF